jgi:alkylation response protein AidB-like acyl-CoA dehydrogenase
MNGVIDYQSRVDYQNKKYILAKKEEPTLPYADMHRWVTRQANSHEGIKDYLLLQTVTDTTHAFRKVMQDFTDMRTSGVSTAFLPQSYDGFGLVSIHDWMVGISRLGQGDGSVALMVNMHLAVSRGMMETWNASKKSTNKKLTKKLELQFEQIISGNMFLCATATEIGTDNLHPFTEATRVQDGWIINGKKIFVTGSPIASHVAMNLLIRNKKETTPNNEEDVIGAVILPLETKGVITQDDWQAMGMRGSGSQSIFFENVFIPEDIVRPIGPWGKWSSGLLMNRNLANLPLLGAFLFINSPELNLPHGPIGRTISSGMKTFSKKID